MAMEAAFSFLFWSMQPSNKDYGMSACCPWPRDSFLYGGLCSHAPLIESVRGHFDLSSEQLEALAVEVKERTRNRMADYVPKYYQTQIGYET